MLQPEVHVDQEWRSNENCLKTFPRHLLVLHKRATEQVLLFAHAPLLELRGGHMAVFQVKVLQVALSGQLAYDVAGGLHLVCLSAQNRGVLCSLARVP